MNVTPLELSEVLLLEPRVFGDARGYFKEIHSTRTFPLGETFVQDNVSFSSQGILRGLHLQHPGAQGKLVMALVGSIFDVAVDVRPGSPTFGKHVTAELTGENHRQLYVPPGFAHGFAVTSPTALVLYKCTALYAPENELSIAYDDPDLGIEWPVSEPQLSGKDKAGLRLSEVPPERLVAYGAPK